MEVRDLGPHLPAGRVRRCTPLSFLRGGGEGERERVEEREREWKKERERVRE